MKWINWFNSQEWSTYVSMSISMVILAFSLWSNRMRAMRTGVRYFVALSGLFAAAANVYILTIAPHPPLAFRVLNYLALTLLVIMVLVTWPRKKT